VLGYSKQRSFTGGERRLIVNEAMRDGITKASDKHQLYRGTIHRWARRLGLEIPWRRFNIQEKRAILQEGISQRNWCDLSSLQNRPRALTVLALEIGTVESWLQQAHISLLHSTGPLDVHRSTGSASNRQETSIRCQTRLEAFRLAGILRGTRPLIVLIFPSYAVAPRLAFSRERYTI
jgi:hypothetical protein